MKTPKEKAQEIVDKMQECINSLNGIPASKQCALIAVDEIQEFLSLKNIFTEKEMGSLEFTSDNLYVHEKSLFFIEQLRKEIQAL